MKNEMLYGRESEYGAFESFRRAVGEYISWYNKTRIRYHKPTKKWTSPRARFEASHGGHPFSASL